MRIAIIGSGMAGLSAAYDLTKTGHKVVLFDGAGEVGGLASGFKVDSWEWTLERFYHHWFASDQHVLKLANELNCAQQILFQRPDTMMYHKGAFYPLDSPMSALLFPGLGWGINKLRFGINTLYLRSTKDWHSLEKISAADWMKRWAGTDVYRTMWEPLLKAKFGSYSDDIPMSWLWARIHARTAQLGTFQGGFQMFINLLADKVNQQGGKIQLNQTVRSITPTTDSKLQLLVNDEELIFDHCIATCSPKQLLQITPSIPTQYASKINNLQSIGAIVLVLALKKRLTNHYWFNLPANAGFPFLALVEHTNFVPPSCFGGEHIIYCGQYLDTNHQNFLMTSEEITRQYLPALTRFNQNFNESWINQSWVFRSPYAQPVPSINLSSKIPELQTPIKGLWLASMSQVYPWDRGTNFAIELGRRVASHLLQP